MKRYTVPFLALHTQYLHKKKHIDRQIQNVLLSGQYILGEHVSSFEKEFASYCRVPYGIGVASGTDALFLAMKALGVGKGDEVILPANAYPTAFAIAASGAVIKLVDVQEDTYTLDPIKLEEAITPRTKVIIPVHLYGQAADMTRVMAIAKKHKIFVVEDCAQAHGAEYKGKKVGSIGDIGCFSFYPSKNLGAMGDGGMVITRRLSIARTIIQLRAYGEKARYKSTMLGGNSRLDELQAAILRIKLTWLDRYTKKRRQIANRYMSLLKNYDVILPETIALERHVYHLFVIRVKKREKVRKYLADHGVMTGVHYPVPIHFVKSFAFLGYKKGDFPITEKITKEILSLPCYPEITKEQINTICNLLQNVLQ